jgi:hypothetical protein
MVRFFPVSAVSAIFASAFRRVTHPGRISLIKIIGFPNLGCSPCLRECVVGLLFFRPRAITAISRHFAALCLRSSAGAPPPIDALLKTKAQPQFDRTVTERLKFFFRVFQPSNHAQFQPVFFVFTVRSAEGCNRLQQTCWQHQPLANGGLLIASCSRLSKIAAQGTPEPKTEYFTLPIVRPRVNKKACLKSPAAYGASAHRRQSVQWTPGRLNHAMTVSQSVSSVLIAGNFWQSWLFFVSPRLRVVSIAKAWCGYTWLYFPGAFPSPVVALFGGPPDPSNRPF